jgi:hypothetical protein
MAPCYWGNSVSNASHVDEHSGRRPRANATLSWHRRTAMAGGFCCCGYCGCNTGDVCPGRGADDAAQGHRSLARLASPRWQAYRSDRCLGFLLDSDHSWSGRMRSSEHSWQTNGGVRHWVSPPPMQVRTSTCSCLAEASFVPWPSRAPSPSERPDGPLVVTCYSVSSLGCCVFSNVESIRRISRSAWCSQGTGRRAAFRRYGFEYVWSGVPGGERPSRTRGTCTVGVNLVGRLHAGPSCWASY